MVFDLDEEEKRKNAFRNWMKKKGYKDAAITAYTSFINSIEKDYQEKSGTVFCIWNCEINDISKLKVILKTLLNDDHAGKQNALKRYIEFLPEYFNSQGVLAHKIPEDSDILPYLSDDLIKMLFRKDLAKLFPQYKISKEAQRENTIILENVADKKALAIMFSATGADNKDLFFDLSSNLKELKELFAEKMSVKGLIITGQDEGGKLAAACANSDIEVKTYSLDLRLNDLAEK